MSNDSINDEGIELIKHFEELRLEAYQDSVGVWTIGWGHTGMTHNDGSVYAGRAITEQEATELLQHDLSKFEKTVDKHASVNINSNQFSALVSFTFNLGETNYKNSTLLRKLNDRNYFGAAKEFKKWNRAGGKRLAGLVRRRISERNLFCSFPNPIVDVLPADWEQEFANL